MSFSIGRAGLDTSLAEPQKWDESGSRVRLSGMFSETSLARAEALRYQLLSLGSNPDETVVPISGDSLTRKTFVYPRSSSVSPPVEYGAKFLCDWSVEAERLPRGGRWGNAESYIVGSTRPLGTILGITPDFWHAVPNAATSHSFKAGGTYVAVAASTRTGPDGVAKFVTSASFTGDLLNNWLIDPANWYDAAAKFTANGYTVAGLECPNDLTTWSLSNGLIKVEPGSTSPFKVTFPIGGTNTSWGTAKQIDIGYYSGSWTVAAETVTTVTVLRNSPQEVAIRLTCPVTGTGYAATVIDLALRRGSHMVDVYIQSAVSAKWGFGMASAVACTTLTGGHRATSNDGDNNRFLQLGDTAFTLDSTNGIIRATSDVKAFKGGYGMELNGSSASSPNQAADVRDQWYAAQSESLTVVNP